MDQALLIYALIALVIVLAIVGPILRKRARSAGNERWEGKKDRQAAGGGLGETLLLATDRDTAEALVAPIFDAGKRVRRLENGSWAQTHYNDDDVVFGVTEVDGGTLVAVQRAIEFAGTLNGMKAWNRALGEISTIAEQRNISVTRGNRALARAEGEEIGGAQVWAPATA